MYNEWNEFQKATHGLFASRKEAANVWTAWDSGTFPTKAASILYHFGKHAGGRTLAKYTADGQAFWSTNRALAKWGTWNAGWPRPID